MKPAALAALSPEGLPVCVIGAGNWGTTIAHRIARNRCPVDLMTRDPAQAREINEAHTNQRSIPGLSIDRSVRATTNLDEAIGAAALVVFAVPSQEFRAAARTASAALRPDQMVLHVTKGLELGTHRRMSQILVEETCVRQFGVLSGPNIAVEIAQGKPAGTVVATHHPRVLFAVRRALASSQLMVFSSDDLVGVEVSGAFKNVVAIAAGMADCLEVGENAKALLLTRGLAEMIRLGTALGAEPTTLVGLAGVGDLMVTCRSVHSRNHRVGVALAAGEPLEAVVARLGMVAEGVHAAVAARVLAREHALELPLFDHVHRVLYEGLAPRVALEQLMALPAGREVSRHWTRA